MTDTGATKRASADQPLADAQRNKYRLLAEKAGLEAGMHVLEIGCGWGGFALYAAQELGCDSDFEMWTPEYGWWLDKRKNNLVDLKK